MATYTLTATAQAATTPPSVRLVVGVSGTGQPAQVTVRRIDADGITRPVRTPYGSTLPVSGGTGLVYDYEYPYGTSATYSLAEAPTVTAAFTMTVSAAWLTHVGIPSRSMSIGFPANAMSGRTSATQRSVLNVLGSSYPITISGGARTAPAGSLSVLIESTADMQKLLALTADASPLLLNVDTSLNLGVGTSYLSLGDVVENRATPLGTSPLRLVDLPYQVVGRPGGPAQAPVTWAMGAAKYPGAWSTVPAGKTWNQAADPTTY